MAIFDSIALGKAKKSIGNVTTVQLKGQSVAKQKITTTTNRKSTGQVAQRNQLKNIVQAWPFVKAGMSLAVSQKRQKESMFNAWVRLFINATLDTASTDIGAILAAIPAGFYGVGSQITVHSAQCTAPGILVTYDASSDLFPAASSIRCFAFDSALGTSQVTHVMGSNSPKTALIPLIGTTIQTAKFVCCYGISEDGKMTGQLVVVVPVAG